MSVLDFCQERISLYLFFSVCLQRILTPSYALVLIDNSKSCHTNKLNADQMAQPSTIDMVSFENHQQQTEYKNISFK